MKLVGLRIAAALLCSTGLAASSALPRPLGALYGKPSANTTQACSFRSPEPCTCPENTVFQNSTTVVTIGANAKHVAAIMDSFFNVSWIGTTPLNTTGKDLTVGATRAMPLGDLVFIEEIVEAWSKRDGSFELAHGQKNVPVVMKNATGSYYFSGYWDDCKASYVSRLETRVVWHAHGCMTLPAGFDTFQRTAIANAIEILKERGQLNGTSTEPQTTVYPPDFASVPCC